MLALTLVLVCEYIKYSRLCPWLFKWPDYEEEQQYEEDGQQEVYNNQESANVKRWPVDYRVLVSYASAMNLCLFVDQFVDQQINYLCNMDHVIPSCKTLWFVINDDCDT